MPRRLIAPVVIAALVALSSPVRSETSADPEIKFVIPLNLTQVSSDIGKVAVYCYITSPAITTRDGKLQNQVELPVSNGQLVTTVTVSVAAPSGSLDNPIGKPATYNCQITGFSTSMQRWDVFNVASATPAFRLSPTPQPLSSNFTW